MKNISFNRNKSKNKYNNNFINKLAFIISITSRTNIVCIILYCILKGYNYIYTRVHTKFVFSLFIFLLPFFLLTYCYHSFYPLPPQMYLLLLNPPFTTTFNLSVKRLNSLLLNYFHFIPKVIIIHS